MEKVKLMFPLVLRGDFEVKWINLFLSTLIIFHLFPKLLFTVGQSVNGKSTVSIFINLVLCFTTYENA